MGVLLQAWSEGGWQGGREAAGEEWPRGVTAAARSLEVQFPMKEEEEGKEDGISGDENKDSSVVLLL